jgi:hypothetical protein
MNLDVVLERNQLRDGLSGVGNDDHFAAAYASQ